MKLCKICKRNQESDCISCGNYYGAAPGKCYNCEALLDSGDTYWGTTDIGIYCQDCAKYRIAELWQRRA